MITGKSTLSLPKRTGSSRASSRCSVCSLPADSLDNRCNSWAVIASYFADKTLVSQQIDSFNEFVNNTMQELVDEGQSLILDQNMQHTGKAGDVTVSFSSHSGLCCRGARLTVARLIPSPTEPKQKRYELHFGQIYLSKPTMTEADGTVSPMFPNEARLRNLTSVALSSLSLSTRSLTSPPRAHLKQLLGPALH